ncbi:hypothetical protein [Streptomyces sp. NPDC057412]|uniref:hypothetical protein n=1 Tax=Streptomyces sp. NPDC057412 TaxID=3346123 RepID=UPI0036AC2045
MFSAEFAKPARSAAIDLGRGLSIAATATVTGRRRTARVISHSVVLDVEQITVHRAPVVDSGVRPALTATRLAVLLAGRRRSYLSQDWATFLAGSPEDGVKFSVRRQFVLALGFLFAALRMRMSDLVRPAWRPVDWLLRTPSRTNAFIASVVGVQAIYIVGHDGLAALVTEVWEPCGIAGASLFALTRWLRRVRGIELAAVDGDGADGSA